MKMSHLFLITLACFVGSCLGIFFAEIRKNRSMPRETIPSQRKGRDIKTYVIPGPVIDISRQGSYFEMENDTTLRFSNDRPDNYTTTYFILENKTDRPILAKIPTVWAFGLKPQSGYIDSVTIDPFGREILMLTYRDYRWDVWSSTEKMSLLGWNSSYFWKGVIDTP